MEENQNQNEMNGAGAPVTYGEESQSYQNTQENNGNQQGYYNQPVYPNGYMNQQPQHGPVSDLFCNILLVLMPLRVILGFLMASETVSVYSTFMGEGATAGLLGSTYDALSLLSNLLFGAVIIFIILDIVKIHNENYKITGLILFAIFLKPGYYIWRAYVLGRKKAFPIVYTVIYSVLEVAYLVYSFYITFSLVFGILQGMY